MAFAITANFLLGTYQGSDSGGRPEPSVRVHNESARQAGGLDGHFSSRKETESINCPILMTMFQRRLRAWPATGLLLSIRSEPLKPRGQE